MEAEHVEMCMLLVSKRAQSLIKSRPYVVHISTYHYTVCCAYPFPSVISAVVFLNDRRTGVHDCILQASILCPH